MCSTTRSVPELTFMGGSGFTICNFLYQNSTIYLERKYELYKQYCRSYKKLYELLESKIGEGCDANTEQTIDISQGSIAA